MTSLIQFPPETEGALLAHAPCSRTRVWGLVLSRAFPLRLSIDKCPSTGQSGPGQECCSQPTWSRSSVNIFQVTRETRNGNSFELPYFSGLHFRSSILSCPCVFRPLAVAHCGHFRWNCVCVCSLEDYYDKSDRNYIWGV